MIFAAVGLTKNAAGVARYLANFNETGLNDIRLSLGFNAGGVNTLLQRNQRLCDSKSCGWFASHPLVGFMTSHTPQNATLAPKPH